VAHQLEVRVFQQMQDIVFGAGKEVIQADNIVTVREQTLAQVRTKETSSSCDKSAATEIIVFHLALSE